MDKEFIASQKVKLEEQKKGLEAELSKFADKDKKVKHDWDTKFPFFGRSGGGGQTTEEEADEVEEYATLLPIEHSLEEKLKSVKQALGKIEKGTYGQCIKCGEEIGKERLEAYPEAVACSGCGNGVK